MTLRSDLSISRGNRMLTCGSSRRNDSTVETGLGNNINLDSRVTTRVIDLARVDLGDGHVCFKSEMSALFAVRRRRKG